MSIEQDPEAHDEDEYDEEADSDFNEDDAQGDDVSSDSDQGDANDTKTPKPNAVLKRNLEEPQDDASIELDSGDEATIKERKKAIRKRKKKGEDVDGESDGENAAWRAKTRSMREKEKDEKKTNKLVRIEGATIDVDKIWEMMNQPGPLPPVRPEGTEIVQKDKLEPTDVDGEQNKENIPASTGEEMITISRKYKFAGEVHVEEKVVSKSSAEARLWISQQEAKPESLEEVGKVLVQRPMRKISRFDPNYNNIDAFKMNWVRSSGNTDSFKGPKLNVVEKSKMDWASHVDAEGLKDELDVHAKAKEGYHSRMEFLNEVEQRKEEEARQARMKR